jgi:PTS system nitrogen regulatory IIA component
MNLIEILTSERVNIARADNTPASKEATLRELSLLLAKGGSPSGPSENDYFRVLGEREALQSTGIGDGVAIPHGAMEALSRQVACVLICPDGVPFDAIDGRPVFILFAVVGPKRATGEHLKTLARISRLLRDLHFREKLLSSADRDEAFDLIRRAEDERAA